MTMYKRFSVIMFLVLFLSLFISTTMKFHFVVGILWILCTCTLFLYVPLRFQQEVPAFQKYVAWIKSGEDGASKNILAIIGIYRLQLKIYQRLLEYIDHNLKYISDYWNISNITQNISAIIEIYRLTDKN